jgi:HEAT repeat protein
MYRLAGLRVFAIVFAIALPCAVLFGQEGLPVPKHEGLADPDERLLQEAGVGTQTGSLIALLQKRSASDADLQGLDGLIRQLGDKDFKVRQQATRKVLSVGGAALPRLQSAMTDADPEVARLAIACLQQIGRNLDPPLVRAVVRVLVRGQPKGALEALLRYLPSSPDEETLEEVVYGLDALALQGPELNPALCRALKDASAGRRAAAACLVGRVGSPEQRAAVRELLSDKDPLVRLRAAQGLLAARDQASIPVLLRLLNEPAVEISWQAEELLHWVAGDAAPEATIGAGSDLARQRCSKAWDSWWQRAAPNLDLGRFNPEQRCPGLILACGRGCGDREGTLWLYGCDGNPRWQLAHLAEPSAMQLVSGNRLLVAEWGGGPPVIAKGFPPKLESAHVARVTERDLDGSIRWEYLGLEVPLSCERLANGNTFLSGRHFHLVELGPDGKEAYHRQFNVDDDQGFYRDPVRLPNGRLLCYLERRTDLISLGEIDRRTGAVLKRVEVRDRVGYFPQLEGTPDGHYLIAAATQAQVLEIDGQGRAIHRWPLARSFHATRLRNGNALVSCQDDVRGRLVETNPSGKLVGEAYVDGTPFHLRVCLGLVRLGFRSPPGLDVTGALAYRLQRLRSKSARVRRGAAYGLEELGPSATPAVPVLIDQLNDPDDFARAAASDALVAVGPAALPALLKATRDRRPLVRDYALGTVAQFKSADDLVLPALIAGLSDDTALVRRGAVQVLRSYLSIHHDSAQAVLLPQPRLDRLVHALIQALQDKGTAAGQDDLTVPKYAAYILGDLGPKAKPAVPALTALLDTPDPELRGLAMAVLGDIGPAAAPAIPTILRRLDVSSVQDAKLKLYIRTRGIWALGQIGPEANAALPTLRKALHDPQDEVRRAAAAALKRIQR